MMINEWRALAENRPPVGGSYLVACRTIDKDHLLILQAWFIPGGGWSLLDPYWNWIPHITHWMYLPLPPGAWARCRKCKQPIFEHQNPVTARDKDPNTEGCLLMFPFYFHKECREKLTPEQEKEMGKDFSELFDGD